MMIGPAIPEESRRLPGVEGIWFFVAADMLMFALLFGSFMVARLGHLALYEHSRQALDPNFGGINTLILLTSSWFLVLAVDAAKRGEATRIPRYVAASLGCAGLFGCSKLFEYTEKLRAGITPLTDEFFMYYFALTGIHLLHVSVGAVGMLWLLQTSRREAPSPRFVAVLETGAVYWHMVDLLWIMLFPLLYLLH